MDSNSETTTITKRIIRINASALKNSACMLHFYRTVIEGYKEQVNTVQIEFGSAVHIFLHKMYVTGGRFDEAIAAARHYFETTKMIVDPKKKYLDTYHLMKVCIEYWTHLQERDDFEVLMMGDGKPAVEVTFSNKYYEDDNYIVLFEGTIDKIGKFKNGCYAIGDYKTTSSWDTVEYLSTYALSPQLRFYYFNLLLFARQNPESLIANIVKYPTGQFIDGIFLNGKDKTVFERSEIFLPKQKEMDEFENMLKKFIFTLTACLHTGTEPQPIGKLNGACTSVYGKCKFFNVCAAVDNIHKQHILKNNFVQREYMPLRNTSDKDL